MLARSRFAEHAKECRRLHGMAAQVSMALLLYLVGLTIYAARRRTELRERFNIAGARLPQINGVPAEDCGTTLTNRPQMTADCRASWKI